MTDIELRLGEVIVAEYSDGSEMDAVDSRRPYVHSVRTTGGTVTTDQRTADHHHHHGVSLTVPDVDGVSYWGGRTYVRDVGSTLLDNHGVQARIALALEPGLIREEVEWRGRDGTLQITEDRRLRVLASAEGWVLDWHSVLTANGDVSIGSPATNGRDGAFYGGIFWRTPFTSATAIVEEGMGEPTAHGSRSPWLVVTTAQCSLIAIGDGRPWFVRTDEYVGFGPALAFRERLEIADGESITCALRVLVTDRIDIDMSVAADLAERLAREPA